MLTIHRSGRPHALGRRTCFGRAASSEERWALALLTALLLLAGCGGELAVSSPEEGEEADRDAAGASPRDRPRPAGGPGEPDGSNAAGARVEARPALGDDRDGDGVPWPRDCDDDDPLNRPGGVEACDGQDNDCDGLPEADFEPRAPVAVAGLPSRAAGCALAAAEGGLAVAACGEAGPVVALVDEAARLETAVAVPGLGTPCRELAAAGLGPGAALAWIEGAQVLVAAAGRSGVVGPRRVGRGGVRSASIATGPADRIAVGWAEADRVLVRVLDSRLAPLGEAEVVFEGAADSARVVGLSEGFVAVGSLRDQATGRSEVRARGIGSDGGLEHEQLVARSDDGPLGSVAAAAVGPGLVVAWVEEASGVVQAAALSRRATLQTVPAPVAEAPALEVHATRSSGRGSADGVGLVLVGRDGRLLVARVDLEARPVGEPLELGAAGVGLGLSAGFAPSGFALCLAGGEAVRLSVLETCF